MHWIYPFLINGIYCKSSDEWPGKGKLNITIITLCKTTGYKRTLWFMPLFHNIKSQKLTNSIYFALLLWLWRHLACKQRVRKFMNVFSISRICMYIGLVNFLVSNTKRPHHLKVGYCEMNWSSGISHFLLYSVAQHRKLAKMFRGAGIGRRCARSSCTVGSRFVSQTIQQTLEFKTQLYYYYIYSRRWSQLTTAI
jgi:hypothetical protein